MAHEPRGRSEAGKEAREMRGGIGCLSAQSKAGLSRSSAFLAARYGGWDWVEV